MPIVALQQHPITRIERGSHGPVEKDCDITFHICFYKVACACVVARLYMYVHVCMMLFYCESFPYHKAVEY